MEYNIVRNKNWIRQLVELRRCAIHLLGRQPLAVFKFCFSICFALRFLWDYHINTYYIYITRQFCNLIASGVINGFCPNKYLEQVKNRYSSNNFFFICKNYIFLKGHMTNVGCMEYLLILKIQIYKQQIALINSRLITLSISR